VVYTFLRRIAKIILLLNYKIEITGKEKLQCSGPFIISANHLSCADPVIIASLFERHIHFLAKQELFQTAVSNWFFNELEMIRVNRYSGSVIRPVRQTLRLLREGEVIGIFPEGTRVKEGTIQEPKRGVAFFAVKSGVPVLPVSITFSRTKMSFRRKVMVSIGEFIKVAEFEKTDYQTIANRLMQESRDLAKKDSGEAILPQQGSLPPLEKI
jgi:1-acyl-sn-glycerol-3-phosphate acyltransferase